ncbi:hypothetical protein ACVWY3_001512 [Bradyrhizobium sp. USDA 4486]
MRAVLVAFLALASLFQAHAQEAAQGRAETSGRADPSLREVCTYTIRGYPQEVPAGVNLCWRAPYPYLSEYGLLHCELKYNLQEITLVKRGDPRCDRYEIRQ